MIRRRVGDEFWLITQDDHARISGKLSQALGPPSSAPAILGITMHDCGWPLHDDQPTLNEQNVPLDVFESPREIALAVWELSAEKAAQRDDYAGLLVSLHSLGLSVYVAEQTNAGDPRARFELNRFQRKMIELQESLRQRLGMKLDRPLKHGLAPDSHDPKEQKLLFDFRWLGAMDRLSLAICCTQPPFDAIEIPPFSAPLKMEREGKDVLLDPWPGKTPIAIHIPYRRLSAKCYADNSEFRAAYAAAAIEQFTATVRGHTI
jgi:hypothetical protein